MSFEQLSSLVRNNRVADLEAMLDNPETRINVNQADEGSGNTLLIVAAQNGNKRCAKLLLRRGAALNQTNAKGNSCLHFAFAFGYTELGHYLISLGANSALRNSSGLTPFEGVSRESLMRL